MKKCTKCGIEKELTEFGANRREKDHLKCWCKVCVNEANRNRRTDPRYAKGAMITCARCRKITPRHYQGESYCKECRTKKTHEFRNSALGKKSTWKSYLWNRYKITPEQWEAQLAFQGGVCLNCGDLPSQKRFHLDHDHDCCSGEKSCGKCIRALLCSPCNLTEGQTNKRPDRALNMVTYQLVGMKLTKEEYNKLLEDAEKLIEQLKSMTPINPLKVA